MAHTKHGRLRPPAERRTGDAVDRCLSWHTARELPDGSCPPGRNPLQAHRTRPYRRRERQRNTHRTSDIDPASQSMRAHHRMGLPRAAHCLCLGTPPCIPAVTDCRFPAHIRPDRRPTHHTRSHRQICTRPTGCHRRRCVSRTCTLAPGNRQTQGWAGQPHLLEQRLAPPSLGCRPAHSPPANSTEPRSEL
jgi:hypothetical protein